VLKHIQPGEYECTWMPVLSYLQLQPLDFDSQYNYDYTLKDTPEQLPRGGLPYYLPKGWYRHALRVNSKYTDDPVWLGSSNSKGEWPVAFHGTCSSAVKSIANQGFMTDKVVRDAMLGEAIQQKGSVVDRPGLYVATHCNGGAHPQYTQEFTVEITPGKPETFQVVFQCRIRPGSYTEHKTPVREGHAWRIVDPSAIRPYGILMKNKKNKLPCEKQK
jgi:hypothetical protein